MEYNLSKKNIINLENDENIFSFKNKDGICLTVCFCYCKCHNNNSFNNFRNKKINKNIKDNSAACAQW